MTTLAALSGALPLALSGGAGAELRQPLGITVVGGLLLSQLLTPFTTPVVYLALDRFSRRKRRPRVGTRQRPPPAPSSPDHGRRNDARTFARCSSPSGTLQSGGPLDPIPARARICGAVTSSGASSRTAHQAVRAIDWPVTNGSAGLDAPAAATSVGSPKTSGS